METQIQGLTELIEHDNPLQFLANLMSYQLSSWVTDYFYRTRDYQLAQIFIGTCYDIIDKYRDQIIQEDFERMDQYLIDLQLGCYDYQNMWEEYINYFEKLRKEKTYFMFYGKLKDYDPRLDAPDRELTEREEIEKIREMYTLRQGKNFRHIHFLYLSHGRYEVIKRKLQRKNAGKSTKHLERHGQDRLSPEELDYRMVKLWYKLQDHIKLWEEGKKNARL